MDPDFIPRAKLTKVPGKLMPVAENDNRIKDLTKCNRRELLDLKRRQENILSNATTLKRLPDKGARIQQFLDKVLAELKRREDVEEAASMFSKLNIATRGEHALNELEWSNGKLNAETLAAEEPLPKAPDSDDESNLKLLRAMANRNKKEVQIIPPEESLITAEDLLEIKSMQASASDAISSTVDDELLNVSDTLDKLELKLTESNENTNDISSTSDGSSEVLEVDNHTQYLINITEVSVTPQREKFKPYKTTISNVHDPAKERSREKGKNWENTAATPPLIQHDATKMLSLMDSINMQTEYLSRLKIIQEKHAQERMADRAERLARRPNIKLPSKEELQNNPTFNVYRSKNVIEGDLKLKENDEIHDPANEETLGGSINYTYTE